MAIPDCRFAASGMTGRDLEKSPSPRFSAMLIVLALPSTEGAAVITGAGWRRGGGPATWARWSMARASASTLDGARVARCADRLDHAAWRLASKLKSEPVPGVLLPCSLTVRRLRPGNARGIWRAFRSSGRLRFADRRRDSFRLGRRCLLGGSGPAEEQAEHDHRDAHRGGEREEGREPERRDHEAGAAGDELSRKRIERRQERV